MAMGIKAWFTTNFQKLTGTIIGTKYALDVNAANLIFIFKESITENDISTNVIAVDTDADLIGMSIYNSNTTTALTIELTFADESTKTINIPPSTTLNEIYDNFTTLTFTGSPTFFGTLKTCGDALVVNPT